MQFVILQRIDLFNEFHKIEYFSLTQICQILLASICFTFENNISIGDFVIAIEDEINKVMCEIEEIKKDEEQFFLLTNMNSFMIQQNRIGLKFPLNKNKWPEGDSGNSQ